MDASFTTKTNSNDDDDDKVLQYSQLLLSNGILYLEFCDGIREGDGTRVFRCWRYMLLFFKYTGRTNYSIEVLTMLVQCHFLLSPRQSRQLMWERFVDVKGLPGHNIPYDLYMEHLNRVLKDAVSCLGANKTTTSIVRTAKAIGVLDKLLHSFDEDNSINEISGSYRLASVKHDMGVVVNLLHKENIFKYSSGRYHPSFTTVVKNPICSIDYEQLVSWMYGKFSC